MYLFSLFEKNREDIKSNNDKIERTTNLPGCLISSEQQYFFYCFATTFLN